MTMIKFLRLFEQEGKFMKQLKLVSPALLLLVLLTGVAVAQKKPVRKAPVRKPPVTVVPPLEVMPSRAKLAVQPSHINGLNDKPAPIAQGLETADADAKAGRLSAATAAKVQASKARVVSSIRDIRIVLSLLESEFRIKTTLQKYLPTIQGIADLAAQSEDLALAGKFVAAKTPLRDISKKLTDTLVSLPK